MKLTAPSFSVGNLRRMALSRPVMLMIEQIASTFWNFALGAIIARLGGKAIFGLYATVLAVNYFLVSPLSSMTVAVVASDVARLNKAKSAYLAQASLAAAKIATLTSIGAGLTVAWIIGKQNLYPEPWAMIIGASFIFFNLISDIIRRLLLLGPQYRLIAQISLGRALALAIACTYALFFAPVGTGVSVVIIFAAIASVVFCASLMYVAGRMRAIDRGRNMTSLRDFTYKRQLILGFWGFLAGMTMTALDQGTLVAVGIAGQTHIAGEIRAAAYLFGLMNPILLVLDLILPKYAISITRGGRSLEGLAQLLAVGAVLSTGMGITIAMASAFVWLPFLGKSFAGLTSLCFWAGAAFACMMTRTFLMPILRTRAPHMVFISSLCGTGIGLTYIFLSPTLTSLTLQRGLTASAATLMVTTVAACLHVTYRARAAQLIGRLSL